MTVSAVNPSAAADEAQHLQANGHKNHADVYKQVLKSQRAHDRTVVGLQVFSNPRNRQLTLMSLAHDSLKLWSITAFEDDFELFPLQTVQHWNCGVQSYTVAPDGKRISLISTDCSLHHISLGETDVDEPQVEVVEKGLMELWFLQETAVSEQFLTVNFQASELQILDRSGEVLTGATFERARQISAIVYSPRYVAIGSSQGVITVVSSASLATLYYTEAHAMKVRCLLFTGTGGEDQQQQQLLTGSDDKTIKLYTLSETRANLERIFCGHKGIVTGLAVCHASGGERFASAGADNSLIVWALASGQKLHTFASCTGTVSDVPRCLTFTPNGRYLLAGTEEAALFAFRLPQPDNYVEEELAPVEVTGEEEEQMEISGGNNPGLAIAENGEEFEVYVPEGSADQQSPFATEQQQFPGYGEEVSPSDDVGTPMEEEEHAGAESSANASREGSAVPKGAIVSPQYEQQTPAANDGEEETEEYVPVYGQPQQPQGQQQTAGPRATDDDWDRSELDAELGID